MKEWHCDRTCAAELELFRLRIDVIEVTGSDVSRVGSDKAVVYEKPASSFQPGDT
jgi:hypothetical protein